MKKHDPWASTFTGLVWLIFLVLAGMNAYRQIGNPTAPTKTILDFSNGHP